MKQRSTTPVSISLKTRASLIVVAVLMAVATPIAISSSVNARPYDNKIRALEQEISQYDAKASKLKNQANSLQQKIEAINLQKSKLQAKIDVSELKYKQLQLKITQTEADILANKTALGDTIKNLYLDGTISPLEMLASSKNIGDFVDKQEYQSSIRDQLNETIEKVKELKKQLELQKLEVEKVLAEQKNSRKELAAKIAEQQTLLAQTKNRESSYRRLVAKTESQLAKVHAQQQAALSRVTNGGANNAGAVGSFQFRNFSGNQGCSGGYPLCAPQDSMVDKYDLYNRECVSYSAWRAERMGKRVGQFSGYGNAEQWPNTASSRMGATVNNSPSVGAVAILPATPGFAPIGHSMNVEAILGGGWVRVSQYNFGGTGEYSTMDVKSSGVVFVHFPN